MLSFKLGSLRATKRLWKVGVENHSFFRLSQADLPPKDVGFIKLGSKFRYRSVNKNSNCCELLAIAPQKVGCKSSGQISKPLANPNTWNHFCMSVCLCVCVYTS